MRLRTLAGSHAGEIRTYRTDVGLAALRTGMAEHLLDDAPVPAAPVSDEAVDEAVSSPHVVTAPRRRARRIN